MNFETYMETHTTLPKSPTNPRVPKTILTSTSYDGDRSSNDITSFEGRVGSWQYNPQTLIGKKTRSATSATRLRLQQQEQQQKIPTATSPTLISKSFSAPKGVDAIESLRLKGNTSSSVTKSFKSLLQVGLPTWDHLELLQHGGSVPYNSDSPVEFYWNALNAAIKSNLGDKFTEKIQTRIQEELFSDKEAQVAYMVGYQERTNMEFTPILESQMEDLPTLLKDHGAFGRWVNKIVNPDVWRVSDISDPRAFEGKAYSDEMVQFFLKLQGPQKEEIQNNLNDYSNSIASYGRNCAIPLLLTLREHFEAHMAFVGVANDLEFQKSQDPVYYDETHTIYENREQDLADMYALIDQGYNGNLLQTELETAHRYDQSYGKLEKLSETLLLLTLCASGLVQSCNLQELKVLSSQLGMTLDRALFLLEPFTDRIPGISKLEFEARGTKSGIPNIKVKNFISGLVANQSNHLERVKEYVDKRTRAYHVLMVVDEIMQAYNQLWEEEEEEGDWDKTIDIFTLPFERQAPIVILGTLVASVYAESEEKTSTVSKESANGPSISGRFASYLEKGEGDPEELVSSLVNDDTWEKIKSKMINPGAKNFNPENTSDDPHQALVFDRMDKWLKGADSEALFKDLTFARLLEAVKKTFGKNVDHKTLLLGNQSLTRNNDPISHCVETLNNALGLLEDDYKSKSDRVTLPNLELGNQLIIVKKRLQITMAKLLMKKFKTFCESEKRRESINNLNDRWQGLLLVRLADRKEPLYARHLQEFQKMLTSLYNEFLTDAFDSTDNIDLDKMYKYLDIKSKIPDIEEDVLGNQIPLVEEKEGGMEGNRDDEGKLIAGDGKDREGKNPSNAKKLHPEIEASTWSYITGTVVCLASAICPLAIGWATSKVVEGVGRMLWTQPKSKTSTSTNGLNYIPSNPSWAVKTLTDHLEDVKVNYEPTGLQYLRAKADNINVPCWLPKKETICQVVENRWEVEDLPRDGTDFIILPEYPIYYQGTKAVIQKVNEWLPSLLDSSRLDSESLRDYSKNLQGEASNLINDSGNSIFGEASILYISGWFIEAKNFLNLVSQAENKPDFYTEDRLSVEVSARLEAYQSLYEKGYHHYLRLTNDVPQVNYMWRYNEKQSLYSSHVGSYVANATSQYHFMNIPAQLKNLTPGQNSRPPKGALRKTLSYVRSTLFTPIGGLCLMFSPKNTAETIASASLQQCIPEVVAKLWSIDVGAAKGLGRWKEFSHSTKDLISHSYRLGAAVFSAMTPLVQAKLAETALDAVGAIGSSLPMFATISILTVAGALTVKQHNFIKKYQEEISNVEISNKIKLYSAIKGYVLDPKIVMNFAYLACHIYALYSADSLNDRLWNYLNLGLKTATFVVDWRRQEAIKLSHMLKDIQKTGTPKTNGSNGTGEDVLANINRQIQDMERNMLENNKNPVIWGLEELVVVPLRKAMREAGRIGVSSLPATELKRIQQMLVDHINLLNMFYVCLDGVYIYSSNDFLKGAAADYVRSSKHLKKSSDIQAWTRAFGSFQNTPFDPEAGISWILPHRVGKLAQPLVNFRAPKSGYTVFDLTQLYEFMRLAPVMQSGFAIISGVQMVYGMGQNVKRLWTGFKNCQQSLKKFSVTLETLGKIQEIKKIK